MTGLGAVMPIGNDFETYWSNLVAGVTGTREVKRFDVSEFEVRGVAPPVRLAAEKADALARRRGADEAGEIRR